MITPIENADDLSNQHGKQRCALETQYIHSLWNIKECKNISSKKFISCNLNRNPIWDA